VGDLTDADAFGFSARHGTGHELEQLMLLLGRVDGKTRMPAGPRRSVAERTEAIGTHRAARPCGSRAIPQSISWSSTPTHSPPSRTSVRKLVVE